MSGMRLRFYHPRGLSIPRKNPHARPETERRLHLHDKSPAQLAVQQLRSERLQHAQVLSQQARKQRVLLLSGVQLFVLLRGGAHLTQKTPLRRFDVGQRHLHLGDQHTEQKHAAHQYDASSGHATEKIRTHGARG